MDANQSNRQLTTGPLIRCRKCSVHGLQFVRHPHTECPHEQCQCQPCQQIDGDRVANPVRRYRNGRLIDGDVGAPAGVARHHPYASGPHNLHQQQAVPANPFMPWQPMGFPPLPFPVPMLPPMAPFLFPPLGPLPIPPMMAAGGGGNMNDMLLTFDMSAILNMSPMAIHHLMMLIQILAATNQG